MSNKVARPLTDDGRGLLRHVQLEPPEIQFVGMLAQRGGEIPWDWSKVMPGAKSMIADLINKGVVIDREYQTHAGVTARTVLRLTDGVGRQVAEQIERMSIAQAAADPQENQS